MNGVYRFYIKPVSMESTTMIHWPEGGKAQLTIVNIQLVRANYCCPGALGNGFNINNVVLVSVRNKYIIGFYRVYLYG